MGEKEIGAGPEPSTPTPSWGGSDRQSHLRDPQDPVLQSHIGFMSQIVVRMFVVKLSKLNKTQPKGKRECCSCTYIPEDNLCLCSRPETV